MANFTISPNMNLIIPTVSVDPGPDWAQNINSCLSILDQHTHAPGSGIAITQAAISLTASGEPYDSLSFNGTNAFALRSTKFINQSAALSLGTDNGCLYEVLGDLYYNNGAGTPVQITLGSSPVGGGGSITGLPSGTASVSYSAGAYVFQSATSTAASIDAGTYILRKSTASSPGISIQAPSALSGGYNFVFPTALPSSTLIMQLDSSGNMSAALGVDNSTMDISSNNLEVKAGGITATQIANLTITAAQIANATITTTQISASAGILATQLADSPQFTGTLFGSTSSAGDFYGSGNSYNINNHAYNTILQGYSGTSGGGYRIVGGDIQGSDGSILNGEGFTSSRSSAGVYTITLSVGSTTVNMLGNITPVAGASHFFANWSSRSQSAVGVHIFNSSGTAADSDFQFILLVRV